MKPMMANPIDIEEVEKKAWKYVMEPKLDGMRLLLHLSPDGTIDRALTRSGRDVVGMIPKAWMVASRRQLEAVRTSAHFHLVEWLDCEFGYKTEQFDLVLDFNKTMRIMGSGAAEAQRKALELDELPKAWIFDLPGMASEPLHRRRNVLDRISEYWDHNDLDVIFEPLEIVPQWQQFSDTYYTYYVSSCGGEGVMLKDPDGEYVPGKRPARQWYKLKKFDSFDGFIVGADAGKGKYEGLIGALVIRTVDGMEIRCSGMTDEKRVYFTAHLDLLVKRRQVVEVKYFGLTAGTPRHPQFMRLRTDKLADECFWQEQPS